MTKPALFVVTAVVTFLLVLSGITIALPDEPYAPPSEPSHLAPPPDDPSPLFVA